MMGFKLSSKWGLPLILVFAWPFVAIAFVHHGWPWGLQTRSPMVDTRHNGETARGLRETGLARGSVLAAAMAGAAATSAGKSAHVRLVNEGDPGPLYECGRAMCEPAQTDDPSRKNRARMDFYVLPEGCVELRGARLRPTGPGVDVVCGPDGSSTSYRCEAGECDPIDPGAGDDGARTWPIQLPADCGDRIHELIVLGARWSTAKFYIECDASSGPLGEP
jgi:hypothetical protein